MANLLNIHNMLASGQYSAPATPIQQGQMHQAELEQTQADAALRDVQARKTTQELEQVLANQPFERAKKFASFGDLDKANKSLREAGVNGEFDIQTDKFGISSWGVRSPKGEFFPKGAVSPQEKELITNRIKEQQKGIETRKTNELKHKRAVELERVKQEVSALPRKHNETWTQTIGDPRTKKESIQAFRFDKDLYDQGIDTYGYGAGNIPIGPLVPKGAKTVIDLGGSIGKINLESAVKRRDRKGGIMEQLAQSSEVLQNTDETMALISTGQIKQGIFQDAFNQLGRMSEFLGADVSSWSSIFSDPAKPEIFRANASKAVLTAMKGMERVSDADRRVIEDSVQKISNHAEANLFLLRSVRAAAWKNQAVGSKWADTMYSVGDEAVLNSFELAGQNEKKLNTVPLVGRAPKSGAILFFNEYHDKMKENNPNISLDEIIIRWKNGYSTR